MYASFSHRCPFESADFKHTCAVHPLTSLINTQQARGDTLHDYPQRHLEFDGGARPRVPERKALSQRHVFLSQQTAQRHRQITQGASVLVILYLCIDKKDGL